MSTQMALKLCKHLSGNLYFCGCEDSMVVGVMSSSHITNPKLFHAALGSLYQKLKGKPHAS